MNKCWLILLLFAPPGSAFAQTDSTYLDLVYQRIRKVQRARTIHYAPAIMHILSHDCEEIKKKITSPDSSFTLKLTPRERKYLNRQLKASKKSSWPDHLFPESKLTNPDTLETTLGKLNRAIFDSVFALGNNAFEGKSVFLKYYWGFWFSRPIYLRNKSILIFCFMWYHSSSGEQNLFIYRKNENTYKYWTYVCGGAW